MNSGLIDDQRIWTTASAAYAEPVAEHTLALMLAMGKDLHSAARASGWDKKQPKLIRSSTVLLIGCGNIGRALIQLLEPFSVEVLAINRSGRSVSGSTFTAPLSDLHRLLPLANYVVVLVPATEQTKRLINRQALRIMARDAFLVNVSRGSVVDTEALVEALDQGEIAGVAADTIDPEPLPSSHPLWKHPNALITPHVACPPGIAKERLARLVEENTARFIRGQTLSGVVDLSNGY